MSEKPTLTTESGAPVTDNQNSQTAGPGGPTLLQDQYLIRETRAVQPRADSRAHRPRGRHRRVRLPRGDERGRAEVDEDADLREGRQEDRHVHSLLDCRGLARRPGRGARSARLRDEVLHRGRQLGPRRQQHADLLHPGRHQVPRLHPLAEAGPVHATGRSRTTSGTSSRTLPKRRTSSSSCSATAAFPRRTAAWTVSARTRSSGSMPGASATG